jgi:hypothetical protein
MRPIKRYMQEKARAEMGKDGYEPVQPGRFRPNLPALESMALSWRMPDGSTLEQEGVHPAVQHLEPRLILDTCETEAEQHYREILTRRVSV